MLKKLQIVEWKYPSKMFLGTKIVNQLEWPVEQLPAKDYTFTLKGERYTVLGVHINLDTNTATVKAMLTENAAGSGIEDL